MVYKRLLKPNGLNKQFGRAENVSQINFTITFSNIVMYANIIVQASHSDTSCVYSYNNSGLTPPRSGTYFWEAIGY